MPPAILLAIQGLQGLIQLAPQIEGLVRSTRDVIDHLFNGGHITVQQQQDLHDHVTAVLDAAQAGKTPPEFVVTTPAA